MLTPRFQWALTALALTSLPIPGFAQTGWQHACSNCPPGGRFLHRAVYDSIRRETIMFGGFQWPRVRNDMWRWDGAAWHALNPGGPRPSPRSAFGFCFDSHRGVAVLFGGSTGAPNSNDTWEWDGSSWTLGSPATKPFARANHAMVYDSARRKTVLFGGGDPKNNETWEWDGTNWTQIVTANAPSARWRFDMAYDPIRRRVVLHGGEIGLTDTWTYDGNNWALLTNKGPATQDHRMVFDNERGIVVLVGGYVRNGPVSPSQTWELHGSTWRRVPLSPAPWPNHRFCMAYDSARKRVVLQGGSSGGTGTVANGWTFDSGGLASFGDGCPGTRGVPVLGATAPVQVGGPLTIRLSNLPVNQRGVVYSGFSNRTWPGGPLPYSLAAIGLPGCSLLVDPVLGSGTSSGTIGAATWSFVVPDNRSLVGVRLFHQAFFTDPGTSTPLEVVATNAAQTVLR